MIPALDLILPIVGAVVASGCIGAEREYRASPAGFRTHILVGLSSALLMIGAVHQVHWLTDTPAALIRIDPVRMAHGVLTGIGFLCGGVIFREGVTVKGLTTAASLWTTAALGTLFGVGFYSVALGGSLATLVVLAASHLSERLLPKRNYGELTVRYRRTDDDSMTAFLAAIADNDMQMSSISEQVEADIYELSATISWKKLDGQRALTSALRRDSNVIGFDLNMR